MLELEESVVRIDHHGSTVELHCRACRRAARLFVESYATGWRSVHDFMDAHGDCHIGRGPRPAHV